MIGSVTRGNNSVKGRSRRGGTLKLLRALTTSVTMAVLLTAAGVPTTVTHVHHDKVSATMAKGGSIINDQGLIVLAQRRGAGEVELHEKTNHVFIIVEGEATFVTGGDPGGRQADGPRSASRLEYSRRADLSPEQRRRDHDSGKDAALVQGGLDAD